MTFKERFADLKKRKSFYLELSNRFYNGEFLSTLDIPKSELLLLKTLFQSWYDRLEHEKSVLDALEFELLAEYKEHVRCSPQDYEKIDYARVSTRKSYSYDLDAIKTWADQEGIEYESLFKVKKTLDPKTIPSAIIEQVRSLSGVTPIIAWKRERKDDVD